MWLLRFHMWDITHLCEAQESFICVSLRPKTHVHVLYYSFMCGTRLMYESWYSFTSDSLLHHTNPSSSPSHVWHDSLLFVTQLPRIYMCVITHPRVTLSHITWLPFTLSSVTRLPIMCDMTPSHVDMCLFPLICAMTPSHWWHDSLSFVTCVTCVTWLPRIYMSVIAHSRVTLSYITWLPFTLSFVTWLPLICDMPPSHLWHDSLSCRYASLLIHMWLSLVSHKSLHKSLAFVTWLPLICDMTPSHLWYASLSRVTWLPLMQIFFITQSCVTLSPPEKLFGDGFSTPMPLFCLICTIISNKTCILD